MSDFLDYYKREEQKRSMTEEEQLELHKKQKQIRAARHRLDDDEFYNESVTDDDFDIGDIEDSDDDTPTIHEGFRPQYNPNRRPVRPIPTSPIPQEPIPQPVPITRPNPRQKPMPEPEELEDNFFVPSQVHTRKKKIDIHENFNDNPAMVKAYTMMNEMQEKIESAFYRYGMSGLEKINKHLEKIFEAIINPKPKEVVKYVEKQVIKPVATAARPIQRQPISVQENVEYETTNSVDNDNAAQLAVNVDEDLDNVQLNERFIKMNESFNAEDLGDALLMQKNEQNKKENTRMQQIEARAKLMQESMDRKKQKQAEAIEEQSQKEYVQPEEFEIVDDPVVEPPVQIMKDPEPAEPVKPKKTKTMKKKTAKKADEEK